MTFTTLLHQILIHTDKTFKTETYFWELLLNQITHPNSKCLSSCLCLSVESSVNESLRLSSLSMNIRVVQEDFCLRLDARHSINLRKDDFVALYPQSTHLDPEIYDQPQVTKPTVKLQHILHSCLWTYWLKCPIYVFYSSSNLTVL